MNILVIEDEPTSLKLAHVILAAEGHHVQEAGASEKALQLIKKDKPDVILLDLALPGMDGLALARILKKDSQTKDIRIIAITSYPDRYKEIDALTAGCDAYITKPINTKMLNKQVENMVPK